jgi:hypothetical protein
MNNCNIVSVAIGEQYEKEVARLVEAYPKTIVITGKSIGIESAFKIPTLNGLATKCKFGLLIPDNLKGPIIFCDADLYPIAEDPLQHFQVKPETDVAYVTYGGTWHFPEKLKKFEQSIQKTGKINSGFIYFKNIDICRDICFEWHKEYLTRMSHYLSDESMSSDVIDWISHLDEATPRAGEYDEPSLVFVLDKANYNLEFLDPKWNVWDDYGDLKDNAYFIQSHLDGKTMYDEIPDFRNEA